ncbi:hypothetical protein HDU76_008616 [Blyttiomyces sp. JEL0837]|nr:hypothetical protein HDU76_008616 [Blyttiomyces sp. JEL0837]
MGLTSSKPTPSKDPKYVGFGGGASSTGPNYTSGSKRKKSSGATNQVGVGNSSLKKKNNIRKMVESNKIIIGEP